MKRNVFLIFTLFLIFFIKEIHVAIRKSITFDEAVHIPVGYIYFQKHDFSINYTHPPLCKVLSGTFLSILNISLPEKLYYFFKINDWLAGTIFFYINRISINKIQIASRIPMIFLGILLGFFIYIWSKDLYSTLSGLFSLFLFTFCPNFLAYSCLVITDVGFTLFFIMTFYFLWKYFKNNNKKYLLLSGLAFGLCLSSKFTGLFIVPLILLPLIFYRLLKRKFKFVDLYHFLISFILIPFLVILFFYQLNPNNLKWFIEGIKRIYKETTEIGQDIYLNGAFSKTGFRNFFLWVFLYKTPIPFIILLFLSFLLHPKINEDEKFLIVPSIVYFIVASLSKKQIGGIRYILPVYGFLYIFVGRLFIYYKKIKLNINLKKIVLWILILWYAFVSLKIHPHYLAYFNQIAGGPDYGWKHLIDNNIDWGQDLKELKKFLEKKENPELMLSYLGKIFPETYGIKYEPFISHLHIDFAIPEDFYHINSVNPKKEYLAISVNNFVLIINRDMKLYPAKYKSLNFLKKTKPLTKIGYSIFVYDITNNFEARKGIYEFLKERGFLKQAERQRKIIERLKEKTTLR